MTFTKVEKIPAVNNKHDLMGFLEQFMAENIKFAEVKFNEHDYKSAKICQTSFLCAIKREQLPIKVVTRKGIVFLVRTDM